MLLTWSHTPTNILVCYCEVRGYRSLILIPDFSNKAGQSYSICVDTLLSWWAAAMPAGPEPTTATLWPLRCAGGSGLIQFCSNAWSMIAHSIFLIVTGGSLMPSTQAPSHGAGHTRPVNSTHHPCQWITYYVTYQLCDWNYVNLIVQFQKLTMGFFIFTWITLKQRYKLILSVWCWQKAHHDIHA